MENQRGRSPSQGHQQNHIKQNHSPSPHTQLDNENHLGLGLGLDNQSTNQQFLLGNFNQSNNINYPDNSNLYLGQQSQSFGTGSLDAIPNYNTSQDFGDQQSPFSPQPGSFTQDLLGANISQDFNGDFPLYPNQNIQAQFDQQFLFTDNANNATLNPAELNMASPQTQPTPPHLLHPDAHTNSSNQNSPSFNQGQFQRSPSHSRHASLGPESAAYPQGGVDWSMMSKQFQGHRRTPSEYSDVSASSAAHSPNLGHQDSFDGVDTRHSPMQQPQDPSLYNDVLAIGNFSLSDPQLHHGSSPGRGLSPAHSPAISPRLSPQQMPLMTQQSSFNLGMNNLGFMNQQNMYGLPNNQFPQMQHSASLDMGQAQQMVPPEINVEFAPASRQNSFEPPKPSLDSDALSPPERGMCFSFFGHSHPLIISTGRRRRAASDPFNSGSSLSRPQTPAAGSQGLGADLQAGTPSSHRSLSPNDRTGAASPHRRRQSTSSLPNRDYILGLADPDYQGTSAEGSNPKRVQKHPATFQCTLCPKRFTRAYNLRSHLRTHTDERPFVCTVCGKAFARQHDRKRHEGLHSGEKKFVCRGELKTGGNWGCKCSKQCFSTPF